MRRLHSPNRQLASFAASCLELKHIGLAEVELCIARVDVVAGLFGSSASRVVVRAHAAVTVDVIARGGGAGSRHLHHQQRVGGIVGLMLHEQVVDKLGDGLDAQEVVCVCGGVKDAQDAVELAQVQSEDAGDVGIMRRPMHGECSFRTEDGV